MTEVVSGPMVTEEFIPSDTNPQQRLQQIVRSVKQAESGMLDAMVEIGRWLQESMILCRLDGTNFEVWAQQELEYERAHAYKLMRFAKRIDGSKDEKLLNAFQQASGAAMWLLVTAPDSVLHEIGELSDAQGSPATKKQIAAIKAKHHVEKKLGQMQLDMATAVIDDSIDQNIELRRTQTELDKLAEKLETAQANVESLERSKNTLGLDLDAANLDLLEKDRLIGELQTKRVATTAVAKAEPKENKQLQDARRELDTITKKIAETQALLAVEEQRVASVRELSDATNAWIKEVSTAAMLEVTAHLDDKARAALQAMIKRAATHCAALQKML